MSPLTHSETQTLGAIFVFGTLAAILLMVVACCVLSGRGEYPQQPRDVADVDEAARRSGFLTPHDEPDDEPVGDFDAWDREVSS